MGTTYAEKVYDVLSKAKEPMTALAIGQECGLGSEQARSALAKVDWAQIVGQVPAPKGRQAHLWQFAPGEGQPRTPQRRQQGKCANCNELRSIEARGLCLRCYAYQRRWGQSWMPDGSEPLTRMLGVMVSESMMSQLQAMAKAEHSSVGAVVRRMLAEAVSE